jgi:ATP-dependent RNA helicase DDX60
MDEQTPEVVKFDSNKAPINSWYAGCRPRFIDLVGDYAGRELFLLEGDSLLRECFSDDRLDFNDGFQMLHAVFVVERFLENLIKRHCRFHIAFYDEHSTLCIPAGVSKNHQPRYVLARSVIIRHLQLHVPETSGIQIHVFPSLDSEPFSRYLVLSPVHFVMAHDGAPPTIGNVRTKAVSDPRAKAMLRGNIWWFNTHRLNVALVNRVEFRDSKVSFNPMQVLYIL